MELNIYPERGNWTSITQRLTESPISQHNKKLILAFAEHGKIHGYNSIGRKVSMHRIEKYTQQLRAISQQINKDLDKVNKKDLEKFISWLETAKYKRPIPKTNPKQYNETIYSSETKADYRITLKVFYKWLEAKKLGITLRELELKRKEPELITWFASRNENTKRKLPEQLLTEDEILKLIKYALTPRDKAFVSMLFESGCRIGELGNLQIKDIAFDEYGTKIHVDGKTGERQIRLITSTQYLEKWLNKHPGHDNPNAPVWINELTQQQITYTTFRKQLMRIAKRAGIKKPINPHQFRHSRATNLASILTEQQLKAYGGWKPNSDMVSVYVHLSSKDIDDALLQASGLKQKTHETQTKMLPKICIHCTTKNEATNIYCEKCRSPLTIEAALNEDTKKELRIKELEIKMQILEKKFLQKH